PARSGAAGPRSSRLSAAAKIAAGSGSRPAPLSRPVRRPVAGGRTTAPRRRSSATLAWVAGCSHISVCMAGAYSTGQRAVSRVAAVYAALPAPTPRTTRAVMVPKPLGAFDDLDAEHPLLELAKRDGQRLLLAARLHQRPDVLEQPFAELGVVGVDLAGALRG